MKMSHHEVGRGRRVSSLMRESIFGLGDGVVSTLGAITGIAAGTGSSYVVILSGCVVIAVESISMAAGTYISSKSERELLERYLAEEAWEIEHQPEKEAGELRAIYAKKGFSADETRMIVSRLMRNKRTMLDEMAFHELKIIPDNLEEPRGNALVMGLSYVVGGLVPLSAYVVFDIGRALWAAVLVSVLVLFGVGVYKTKLTHTTAWKSGVEMVAVSLGAALAGYGIASLFNLFLA